MMRRRFLALDESLYEWVDLGLPSGLKWAAWNVGATKPEEYGLYFAWGETQGYTGITDEKGFYWGDYEYTSGACTGTTDTSFRGGLTKYNTASTSGFVDNLITLESSDDAASATQSTCKMPTKADFDELTANTTSTWETFNGVNGRRFTSNANGNSIFVPAAGLCDSGSLDSAGASGQCWSSSLGEESGSSLFGASGSNQAWVFGFSIVIMGVNNGSRYCGKSVRPVKDK